MARGLENCAQCEVYICNKLKERLVDLDVIKTRAGQAIPEDDYQNFIRLFENKKRLEALRKKQ